MAAGEVIITGFFGRGYEPGQRLHSPPIKNRHGCIRLNPVSQCTRSQRLHRSSWIRGYAPGTVQKAPKQGVSKDPMPTPALSYQPPFPRLPPIEELLRLRGESLIPLSRETAPNTYPFEPEPETDREQTSDQNSRPPFFHQLFSFFKLGFFKSEKP